MATPKPQHPFHVRLQSLEKQRQDRIMSNLRDAVLERMVAATPSRPINSGDHVVSNVERRLRQLIPKVYTPSHPPYASMIQRAIEKLNEEGGRVSEMAISKFIRRRYESLPWAHEGLLRLHLKKQCEMGMLVSLEGGRYNFNVVKDGDDVEAEIETRRKRQPPRQGRRSGGRWRDRKEKEQINEAFGEVNESTEQETEDAQDQNERPNKDQLEKALVEANKDEDTDDSKRREEHDQHQQKSQFRVQERRPSRRRKVMDHVDVCVLALVPCAPHEEQPRRRRRGSKAKNDMDSSTAAGEVHCAIKHSNEQKPRRRRGRPKATR